MAFTTTPEQDQLRDLVRRACGDQARSRDAHEGAPAGDPSLWKQLGEAGLLTLGVPEDLGGSGGTVVDQVLVAEELGRAVSPAPYVTSSMMAASLLVAARDTDGIGRIADGAVVACVHDLPERRRVHGDLLQGVARHVVDGPVADLLVVVATDETGLAVALVDATAPGVGRTDHPSLDRGRPLSTLALEDVTVRRLAEPGEGWEAALERARRVGAVGLAAESSGVARRCLDLSREYALTRRQFGEVIGQFQATKHRLADMLVLTENAHAAVRLGAFALAGNGDDVELSVAAAKAVATDAAADVAAHAIQLHGGIAITWEHDLHLFLRRARTNQKLLGEPSEHRERIAARLLAHAGEG